MGEAEILSEKLCLDGTNLSCTSLDLSIGRRYLKIQEDLLSNGMYCRMLNQRRKKKRIRKIKTRMERTKIRKTKTRRMIRKMTRRNRLNGQIIHRKEFNHVHHYNLHCYFSCKIDTSN